MHIKTASPSALFYSKILQAQIHYWWIERMELEAPPALKLSAGGASKFIQILLQIPLSEIEIGSNSVNFG